VDSVPILSHTGIRFDVDTGAVAAYSPGLQIDVS
jgi:hypothetical protein